MPELIITLTRLALKIALFVMVSSAHAQVTLNLNAGWNLLGNSSAMPIDAATTFGDPTKINSVWTWNKLASKWAFYAPSMSAADLATYAQGKGYDLLISIPSKEGFWVNAETAFLIGLQDSNNTSPTLDAGWNLVTTGNQVSPAVFTALQPEAHINSIWAWDAPSSKWYFYAPSLDSAGTLDGYLASKGYLNFAKSGTQLGNGTGFWVSSAGARSVDMTIRVTVPVNTPSADVIWLRTGTIFGVNDQDIVMNKVASGPDIWQASVTAPKETILNYFYRRNGDWGKKEIYAFGVNASWMSDARETIVRNYETVNETIAQWEDLPLVNSTGTIIGLVTSPAGNPVMDIGVSAGPHRTHTRWDGTYRIPGIPFGPSEITFRSDNGEFATSRTSVTVSSTAKTAANAAITATTMVNVIFQVTVPDSTPAGAVPRLYGDTYHLGMFPYYRATTVDSTRVIDMTLVSGATWSATTSLGIGSCVNYTYTLGSGSLNNERDSSGNSVVRAICVTSDMTVNDRVTSWKSPLQVPVTFTATSPTGASDTLYMTADDWGNFPMKMWPTGAGTASYVVYSDPNTIVKYRYLRNGDGNLGVEIVPPGDQDPPLFRSINSGATGTTVNDTISSWRHQMIETALSTVRTSITDTIVPRIPGSFQTGVEFWDWWRPSWRPLIRPSITHVRSKNVQWVQIASVWDIRNMSSPIVEQGGNSFTTEELIYHIREVKMQGLKVALKGFPYPVDDQSPEFSVLVPHSNSWYDLFFAEVKAAQMYHARIAQQEGVEMLILANFNFSDDGGPASSAATRTYINAKWKDIIASVRTVAPSVKLTIDNYVNAAEYDWYGDLDYLGDKWWSALATSDNASVTEMYATALSILNTNYKPISDRFGGKPFIFAEVAYYSANTSAMQQYQVYSPEISDFTAAVAKSTSDYDEQARAYQATLLAFANTPWVQGCYSFGYAYFDFDSKGYSIRGKTAEEIMSQIYKQLNEH